MTSIITQNLRKNIASQMLADFDSDDTVYHIGIGKTDNYSSQNDTVINPVNNELNERIARTNLESIKAVTNRSHVTERVNWNSGTIYNSWTDNVRDTRTNIDEENRERQNLRNTNHYVINETNDVYICLYTPTDNLGNRRQSIVQPTGTSTSIFQTSDRYRWKYLYTVIASDINNFLTAAYMPVSRIENTDNNPLRQSQINVQEAAIGGQIIGVEIVEGGTGYTSDVNINILGNGTGALFTAEVDSGSIVRVRPRNATSTTFLQSDLGFGYDYASVDPTNINVGTVLRPIIGPKDGFGHNPVDDLEAYNVMFITQIEGDEGGEFNTTNDFRQITLFRNLTNTSDSAPALITSDVLKVNKSLTITQPIGGTGFSVDTDDRIMGNTSLATAFIDEIDGQTIRYHQNERTVNNDFNTMQNGDPVTMDEIIINDAGARASIATVIDSPIDLFSGDLLYIENIQAVRRGTDQQEDIKIVIEI